MRGFGAALAALTGGKVVIGCNSVSAAKIGLAIAVRYTSTRRAFAPAVGEPEVSLLSYSSIQKRLMVPLASRYVYTMCGDDLRAMLSSCLETGRITKEMDVLSSGFKAVFTWFTSDALQNGREACGGQGYKSERKIGLLRADRDISLTFEGANDVLMQQVAKECLTEFLHSLAAQLSLLTKSRHMAPVAAWDASLAASSAVAHAHVRRRTFDMHRAAHIPRAARVGAEVEAAARLCGELRFLRLDLLVVVNNSGECWVWSLVDLVLLFNEPHQAIDRGNSAGAGVIDSLQKSWGWHLKDWRERQSEIVFGRWTSHQVGQRSSTMGRCMKIAGDYPNKLRVAVPTAMSGNLSDSLCSCCRCHVRFDSYFGGPSAFACNSAALGTSPHARVDNESAIDSSSNSPSVGYVLLGCGLRDGKLATFQLIESSEPDR